MTASTLQHRRSLLSEYLKREIFPELASPPYGVVRIRRLSRQKPVYLFVESTKNITVVGKSFKYDLISLEQAWLHAEREYFNLKLLREELGMDGDFYHVVAPLGKNRELSALLMMEMAQGKMLV